MAFGALGSAKSRYPLSSLRGLGLCPDNRIRGDKVLSPGTRHVVNRAATALRLGARPY
jgi:hypothetical protein